MFYNKPLGHLGDRPALLYSVAAAAGRRPLSSREAAENVSSCAQ